MLILGPYRAVENSEKSFDVFNLTSPMMAIPRLPGLIPPVEMYIEDPEQEKQFDLLFYKYIFDNIVPFSSVMQVMMSLYTKGRTFVCISPEGVNDYLTMINESFMKMIQERYGIKYALVNESSDIPYVPDTGCDFATKDGICQFDADRKYFCEIMQECRSLF